MGDVRELKRKAPQTDLAAQVSQKLETARTRCAELDQLADAMALSVALEELGATGKLAKLNAELDTARRDVAQLEGALRLAEQRDAMAQAAIDAKGRRAQLAIMRGHADARLEAANELCTALEVGSKALARFYAETDALALALPLGLIQHAIAWHQIEIEIDGRLFPARVENVIAGEMYRHADLSRRDRPSGAALPGASPPVEHQRLNPAAIEPAVTAVRRANEHLLRMVDEKISSIERANAAKFSERMRAS